MPNNALWPKQPKKEDQLIHMWTPFHIRVDGSYRFFPKNRLFHAVQRLLYLVLRLVVPPVFYLIFGLRVHGHRHLRELPGGAVTVCNHVHCLDCVMLECYCHPRNMYFLSLKSNFEIPVIRHIIRLLGAVPIPDTGGGMAALTRGIEAQLQKGNLLQIYPEGILYPYYDTGLRDFHKGAFYYACHSKAPVLPFVITFRPRRGWRSLLGKKPLLDLHILEPVYPDDTLPRKEAEVELCGRVQAAMKHCMAEAAEKNKRKRRKKAES